MFRNQKRIIMALTTALGAVLAFFGVRSFIRWMQSRPLEERRQERVRRQMQVSQGAPEMVSSHQPQDQPDRIPVPATGAPAPTAAELMDVSTETGQAGAVEELTGPLVQYLLSFNSMIEQLRSRRKNGEVAPNGRSLTPDDRSTFQVTLDRLEEQMPDYDEGDLEDGSLQERMYRLTVKVRGALQNLDHTDDDLFRINGEVRSETCRLLAEITAAGAGGGADFDQVRQVYNCD